MRLLLLKFTAIYFEKSFHNKNNSIRNLFSYIAPIKTIITDIIYSTNADYLPDIEEIEQFPKLLFISEKMTKSFLTRIHKKQ